MRWDERFWNWQKLTTLSRLTGTLDWWEDGKIGYTPPYAVMEGSRCVEIARDEPTVMFLLVLQGELEAKPLRYCNDPFELIRIPHCRS